MEPTPSPFDVRWRMFGIGVRIHPTFWLFNVAMGWPLLQMTGNAWLLVIFVLGILVSILAHELGHVIAGRIFGKRSDIILHSLGGLAVGNFNEARRWQRIIIYLAGPAAGFALYGLIIALDEYWFRQQFYNARSTTVEFSEAIRYLKFFNLFWTIVNLAPVYPLDGGQVLRDLCTGVSHRHGERLAYALSFVIAAALAGYSFMVFRQNQPGTPLDQQLFWPRLDESHRLHNRLDQPLIIIILFAFMAVQNLLTLLTARGDAEPAP